MILLCLEGNNNFGNHMSDERRLTKGLGESPVAMIERTHAYTEEQKLLLHTVV